MEPKLIDRPFVLPAVVLALGMVLSMGVAGYTFYSIRSLDNTVSATGSAKTQVTADSVKWGFNITRTTYEGNLPYSYALLDKDAAQAEAFLVKSGVKKEDITVSPPYTDEVYKYNSSGQTTGPKEYSLRKEFYVQSKDVSKITEVANKLNALSDSGIKFSSMPLQYYYTKLNELRVSLLTDAIKDARARAEKMAKTDGARVGKLKSASSGVVQVLALNSTDISDYGNYDTSTIEKDVMVTLRAVFQVK